MMDPIQEIGLAAERIRAIADDILDAERAEMMITGILMEGLEFNVTLHEAVKSIRASADLKHQTYQVDWSSEPMRGRGDSPLISAAASNLISNAIKYTPEGGVIKVSLRRQNARLYFEVTDNGYGIPAKSQAMLFEPMHRAKTKETRNIEGTGFGLYLVKLIVQRHGGDVFFTSTYHQGSTFGFWLPLDAQTE
jgi:signal transduction histidine kinase